MLNDTCPSKSHGFRRVSAEGGGVAAAVGMFDGVHLGHQKLVEGLCGLSAARGLIPGIFTFTDHPMAVVAPERAPELMTTIAQRSNLLVNAGAHCVVALRFDEKLRRLTAEDFMRLLRDRYGVRLLLIGFNHRFGSDRLADFAAYQAIGSRLGIEVHPASALYLEDSRASALYCEGAPPGPVDHPDSLLPAPDREESGSCPEISTEGVLPVSSSLIRTLLKTGDIPTAERLLGHPFTLCGRVVHGRALGRTIDFPTANIKPYIPNQLLPLPGAYAAWLTCHDCTFPAMVNIGTNPTVSEYSPLSTEAHIIGYHGDLYDMPVTVAFKQRLRGERRFPDLTSLMAQLKQDRQHALSVLLPS